MFLPERTAFAAFIDVDIRNAWLASRDYSEASAKDWMCRVYSIDGSYSINGTYLLSYKSDISFVDKIMAKKLI